MLPGKEIFFLFIGSCLLQTATSNTKHMYALCPPDFFGIGTECYYISKTKVNWLDAHFDCKDRKSRLAEPIKYEDRMIRRFLMNNDQSRESKWIGGNYNWAQKKWQWQDGKEFTYQSFSQMPGGKQELQYHCAILNPELKYRWSASSCVDKHQYICQHRMPYVNAKHRSTIYTRWNQTYPNEKANEVEVILNESDILKRGHRQSVPITGRSTNAQRLSRHRNYLASEWLKNYKTRHIFVDRNGIFTETNNINVQQRKVTPKPNRFIQRRRKPNIGRDEFITFERQNNINRGALITNKVEDNFERSQPATHSQSATQTAPATQAPAASQAETTNFNYERYRDPVQEVTSSPRRYQNNDEIDIQEKKRLEETRKMLETGRYEVTSLRRRTTSTTTTSTPPDEANVSVGDNEMMEYERNRELENRRRHEEEARERQRKEEYLQNQIDEETSRIQHEEELRKVKIAQEEQQREEERERMHQQQAREKEERMRLREIELKEREEEEQRLREDEERRQAENRQRLEEIEQRKREEQEKQRIDAENKLMEEENRRRRKEELRQKKKTKENQVSESSEEDQMNDLRLKEKLRREKLARMRERLQKLKPEDRAKFFELRGKRNKKESENKENETTTNQL